MAASDPMGVGRDGVPGALAARDLGAGDPEGEHGEMKGLRRGGGVVAGRKHNATVSVEGALAEPDLHPRTRV